MNNKQNLHTELFPQLYVPVRPVLSGGAVIETVYIAVPCLDRVMFTSEVFIPGGTVIKFL